MNTFHRAGTVLMSAGVSVLMVCDAGAVNPLINTTFDTGLTGWTTIVTQTGLPGVGIDPCRLDSNAARARVTVQGKCVIIQQVTGINTGDIIAFSGLYCGFPGPGMYGFFNSTGDPVTTQWLNNEDSFNIQHTVTSGQVTNLWVGCRAYDGTDIYMDDVALSQVGTPAPTSTPTVTPTPTVTATPTPTPQPPTAVQEYGLYE